MPERLDLDLLYQETREGKRRWQFRPEDKFCVRTVLDDGTVIHIYSLYEFKIKVEKDGNRQVVKRSNFPARLQPKLQFKFNNLANALFRIHWDNEAKRNVEMDNSLYIKPSPGYGKEPEIVGGIRV